MGQPKSTIGINLANTSVKLAQLVARKGQWKVNHAIMEEVADSDQQKEIVAEVFKRINYKNTPVICVVDSPDVVSMNITIPHMPKQEMLEAIRWEANNYLPYSLEEAVIDSQVIRKIQEGDVKKYSVLAAAMMKREVERIFSLFTSLKINLKAIIPMSLAQQSLIFTKISNTQEPVAILQLGELITELNVFSQGQLNFSRKLPVTGIDITKSLTAALVSQQGTLQLTVEEAEKIKREHGIPNSDTTETFHSKISKNQALSLIRPKVEQLVSEIERSLDFYREDHGQSVKNIVLFGGGARLKSLPEFLTEELELPVEVGNSFEYVEIESDSGENNDKYAHRFNLAIGAGLNAGQTINLIPIEVREKNLRFFQKTFLISAISIVLLCLGALCFSVYWKTTAYKKNLVRQEKKIKELSPKLKQLEQRMILFQKLKETPKWKEVLKEISNVISPYVYLTEVNMNENAIGIKGVVTQGNQANEVVLSDFMLRLEDGIFKNVSLISSQELAGDLKVSEFELKAIID